MTDPTLPTLVLLPGMACDAELYRHQVGALQHGGALVVADVHQRAESLPAMVELLLDEVPGELLLAGCSLGGMLALEAWRQAPQRVRGLAILGSTARADTPDVIALRSQACELFAQGRMEEVLRVNAAFAFEVSHVRALLPDYLAMMFRCGAERLPDGRLSWWIEHETLKGVTPRMLVWWFSHLEGDVVIAGQRIARYRAWHPYDHVHASYARRLPDGSVWRRCR